MIRVLFAISGSVGHAYPLIHPRGRCPGAGHEVHFAAGDEVRDALAANGIATELPVSA